MKSIRIITSIVFLILQFSNITHSQVIQDWVARYSEFSKPNDGASEIISDKFGNIFVTGSSIRIGTNYDYVTIKYSSSGNIEWINRYNGPGNNDDISNAILLDSVGNVYVTGGSFGSGSGFDIATIKYSPSGEELWVSRYTNSGNHRDAAYAIAIDDSNNIYVTGESYNLNRDYVTIKYNSEGIQQWIRFYNPGNYNDIANSIAVDDSSNIYVTGKSLKDTITFADYATIKYNSNGTQIWSARYNGPFNGDDFANSIGVDSLGNVYVSGSIEDQFHYGDYATIKYNNSGMQEWVRIYSGTSNFMDVSEAMKVDKLGNSYVTGYSTEASEGYNITTIKYNSNGQRLWIEKYNNGLNDIGFSIDIDDNGNVYVTGESDGNGTSNDFATIKYDSSGNQQWCMRYDFSGQFGDFASAINVDHSGNVYVSGSSDREYLTIKYSQLTQAGNQISEMPKEYFLSQNYPNPFNPSSNLEFGISILGFVTLRVYDVLGNEIVTLVNEKKNPGSYEVVFDGSAFASAIYFYSLYVDGKLINTKRMILLK